MVVINCRDANSAMNDCLTSYKNAEQFAKYKSLREVELLGTAERLGKADQIED
jgi:hypothetical protein